MWAAVMQVLMSVLCLIEAAGSQLVIMWVYNLEGMDALASLSTWQQLIGKNVMFV